MKKLMLFVLAMMIFPLLSCEKKDDLQKVVQQEHEADMPKEDDLQKVTQHENEVNVPTEETDENIDFEAIVFESMGNVQGQHINYDAGSDINPPQWLQGVWQLEESYLSVEKGWIDRSDEEILLKFEPDNISIDGKNIKDDGYYQKDTIKRIATGTGDDFPHGEYYVIMYALPSYVVMSHRYYHPGKNMMRTEVYKNNIRVGIEKFKASFIFTDAIAITDVLNVRTSPSVNGEIIKTKKFGDVFQVYDEQGSGGFLPGVRVVDSWYKIALDKEEWVNAYYVRKFPFYIAGENSINHPDNGGNDMYTRSLIAYVKNAYEDNGTWFLNMDIYSLEDGVGGFYKEYSRSEQIKDSYSFDDNTVTLKNNLFNHVVELRRDTRNRITDMSPSVAWSWYHYNANEYDLSEMELKYGIRTGITINDVQERLGSFYFQEYSLGNVFVY